MSTLKEAALAYARRGIPVFPCQPGLKKPATENGFHDATTDEWLIEEWWTENPNYNIAFTPHSMGWGIVDIDPPDGQSNWAALCAKHGEPPRTWTVRTPRGGDHAYYGGELPTYVGKGELAHVDTRGRGSYALLPPSRTADGEYSVADATAVAPLPGWVLATIEASKTQPTKLENPADVELDRDWAVSRATTYLRTMEPLTERGGADEGTYVAACHLRDLGISHATAVEMMLELLPITPWDAERTPAFIEFKADNAYRYATNDAGVRAPPNWEKVMANLPVEPEPSPEVQADSRRKSRFWPMGEAEMDALREPEWSIPDLIPEACTMLLLGESGSLKSFIAVDIGMAIASGVPSCFGPVRKPGPVFYGALEGLHPLASVRRKAWRAAHAGQPVPDFYVMAGPRMGIEGEMDEFLDMVDWRLGDRQCGAIFIDTAARAMAGWDENSAKDMGQMIQALDRARDMFKCPIIVLHHLGKDKNKMGRGSGAIYGAMDTVCTVTRPNEYLPAVSMKVVKQKDAEERPRPWYLEGVKTAGSLAMHTLETEQWLALTEVSTIFDRIKVGRALRGIQAVLGATPTTTNLLACELIPAIENEPPEAREKRIGDAEKVLTRLSKDHSGSRGLGSYTEMISGQLMWGTLAD